jgi:TPP-dependent pyruvate/acetoin dehydrogenase alpha subunit
MHMFSVEANFYGVMVSSVPQCRLAPHRFANRYRQDGKVCLTYFGDGAANQGHVYESFNRAELWKLPIVYVIENNRLARCGNDRNVAQGLEAGAHQSRLTPLALIITAHCAISAARNVFR